jgi:hypothetical protein
MRSGKSGKVKVGTTYVAEVINWKLETSCEVSKHGVGGVKVGVAGVLDYKGSFEYVGDTALQVGQSVSLLLEEGEGGQTWSGTAIISKGTVTVNPDTGEAISYSVDFEGSGAFTTAS